MQSARKADVYVTSDVKYHEYFQAEGAFNCSTLGIMKANGKPAR